MKGNLPTLTRARRLITMRRVNFGRACLGRSLVARLEDLTRGAAVKGILPDSLVTVVDVKWIGTVAVELTYKAPSGALGNELLYRDREPMLEIAVEGRPWSFDGDGAMFRLVSEAHRIRLAYLFDPLLAVHTSLVEPLPHQITAVYGEMLSRQPLRFGVGGALARPGALHVKRVVLGDEVAAAARPPNCPGARKSDNAQTLQQAPKCLSRGFQESFSPTQPSHFVA
jgi:hypothetical protein